MTKTEFVKVIAAEAGLTQAQAGKAFDAAVATVNKTLAKGEKVAFPGFGTFEVKDIPAKQGINPATKKKITIPACKRPAFKFSKTVKEALNK